MKTLTKKQRREIYLNAANEVFAAHEANKINLKENSLYLCHFLGNGFYDYRINGGLPEFELFKPTQQEQKQEGTHSIWWQLDGEFREYGVSVRIICMLLCAEMCNP